MKNSAKTFCLCVAFLAFVEAQSFSAARPKYDLLSQHNWASPSTDVALGNPTTGLQISLQAAQTVTNDQPVYLDIILKNTTDQSVNISSQGFPMPKILLTVKDREGETVPLTRYGHLLYKPMSPMFLEHNFDYTIQPGEEKHVHVLLSRIFDMSTTGDYSVTAQMTLRLLSTSNEQTFVSPALKINISEIKI